MHGHSVSCSGSRGWKTLTQQSAHWNLNYLWSVNGELLAPRSLLVLFQLNRANGANAVQRMLKPAEFTVTIAKVPVDATTPGDMIRVVRVCDREASQHPELRLDQIEPRRVSGSPHRLDAQSPQQGEERGMVVDVAQVIHDDEQASTGIAGAEASKGLAHLADPLAAPKHTIEAVGVNIVEAQELLDAVPAMVGRAPAPRLPAAGPRAAAEGADFQWTPFVEAHYGRTRRAVPIEPADAFFLRSKAGSEEVFQVRMRWAVRP